MTGTEIEIKIVVSGFYGPRSKTKVVDAFINISTTYSMTCLLILKKSFATVMRVTLNDGFE